MSLVLSDECEEYITEWRNSPEKIQWLERKNIAFNKWRDKFSVDNINSLTQDDVRQFLGFNENQSWDGLQRNRIWENMDELKKTLGYLLVNINEISLDEIKIRIDNVLSDNAQYKIKGLARAVVTGIIHICDTRDRLGVWNSKVVLTLIKLGIIDNDPKGSPGEQYIQINNYLNQFKEQFNLNLYEVDILMHEFVVNYSETFNTNIKFILDNYLEAKTNRDKRFAVGRRFKELVTKFKKNPQLSRWETIDIKYSMGMGSVANVPWLAFLDSRITDTTQKGVYVAYLFKADMTGFYLTLTQGVGKGISSSPTLGDLEEIHDNAISLRQDYDWIEQHGFSLDDEVSLADTGNTGRSYEKSVITYRYYPVEDLPNEDGFLSDLEIALRAYEQYIESLEPDIAIIGPTEPEYILELINDIEEKGRTWTDWTYRHPDEKLELLKNTIPFWFYFYMTGGTKLVEYRGRVVDFEYYPEGLPDRDDKKIRGRYFIDKIEKIEPPRSPDSFQLFDEEGTAYNIASRMRNPDSQFLYVKNMSSARVEQEEILEIEQEQAIQEAELIEIEPQLDLYDPSFISEVESLLLSKKQIILQGPPGTSKTHFAIELAKKNEEKRPTLIQFHPSYSYENFVEGLTVTESGRFEPIKKVFLKKCEEAERESPKNIFLIIDEINRGLLGKIFGELIIGLEYREKQKFELPYSEKTVSIPSNLVIIGTMNTADRSIALVDYALRRRFFFIDMMPDDNILQGWLDTESRLNQQEKQKTITLFKNINQLIKVDPSLGENFQIGHTYYFIETINQMDIQWKYAIRPLLKEYFFGDGDKLEDYDNLWEQFKQ